MVSAACGVLIVAGMSGALGDQYMLGELIGSGGMGLVYAAEQPCLARTVAVKLMRAELVAEAHMRAGSTPKRSSGVASRMSVASVRARFSID